MSKPKKHLPPARVSVPKREFDALVGQSLDELPPRVQGRLDNVAVMVQEWPTDKQLSEAELGHPQDLFGLYEGVPLTERRLDDVLLPDRITIFRGPILAACATREEVTQEVRATVRHEVAHFLGMDEADLEEIEGR